MSIGKESVVIIGSAFAGGVIAIVLAARGWFFRATGTGWQGGAGVLIGLSAGIIIINVCALKKPRA